MKTKKMSLANIKDKLSRAEMKKIMAGSGSFPCYSDFYCQMKYGWNCGCLTQINQCGCVY